MPLSKGDKTPSVIVNGVTSKVTLPFSDSATVLFFYPTNRGSSCVTEVVDFDHRLDAFSSLGIKVAGVTTEPVSEVTYLKESKRLSITLCSDPLGRASDSYGVRNAYGFADRYTFLISKEGFVLAVWQAYDTEGHAEAVLRHCRSQRLA